MPPMGGSTGVVGIAFLQARKWNVDGLLVSGLYVEVTGVVSSSLVGGLIGTTFGPSTRGPYALGVKKAETQPKDPKVRGFALHALRA